MSTPTATPTASIIGAGTTLAYGTAGASPTYTGLGEVKDVKAPHTTVDKYEATHYTSPNLTKEFKFGWKDGGEVDVEFNYLTATQTTLNGLTGVISAWQITLPDTHTWSFTGAITDVSGSIPNKGICDIKIKIKLTGLAVYA